jgi:hypothetical protein
MLGGGMRSAGLVAARCQRLEVYLLEGDTRTGGPIPQKFSMRDRR